MIEKLNAGFVNTWIIIPQFKKPDEFFSDETTVNTAKAVESEFTYPVDSIILSAEGNVLGQGEFQEMCSTVGPAAYLQMLEDAIEK